MRFRDFIQMLEQGGGGDQGLMVNSPYKTRKPSDGYPFAQNLSPYSGGTGGGGGAAPAGGAAMMRKAMKKKMKKK